MALKPEFERMSRSTITKVYQDQDQCLLALEIGERIPTEALLRLPPFRALMLARIAERMQLMTKKEVHLYYERAQASGGFPMNVEIETKGLEGG